MATHEPLKVATIEELVAVFEQVEQHAYYLHRWTFNQHADITWVDGAIGSAWNDAYWDVKSAAYTAYDEHPEQFPQARDRYQAAEQAVTIWEAANPQPPKKRLTLWWLEGNRNTPNIYLNEMLATALIEKWGKRADQFRYSYKTAKGILAMLGKDAGFKARVVAEKKRLAAEAARSQRNGMRRNLAKQIAELETLIDRYSADLGITCEMVINHTPELAARLEIEA